MHPVKSSVHKVALMATGTFPVCNVAAITLVLQIAPETSAIAPQDITSGCYGTYHLFPSIAGYLYPSARTKMSFLQLPHAIPCLIIQTNPGPSSETYCVSPDGSMSLFFGRNKSAASLGELHPSLWRQPKSCPGSCRYEGRNYLHISGCPSGLRDIKRH